MLALKVLLLLLIANGAPILARNIAGTRFLYALDGGRLYDDGRPLFGPSKTILGVVASALLTTLAASLFGFSVAIGLLIAATAMLGDLFSSFVKRRLGYPPSSFASGLDQIPEALLPALILMPVLGLSFAEVILVVAIFVVVDLSLSILLYAARVRSQPY
ncbi:hypothetical protein CAI21_00330 [Alkalilimnicola ehrlichii]|uniref:CDP-archaeol synthase n=1 Tax=Alkalilimnicola ehrlichii TaxID=351052 RepID=A0A3E0X3Z7_9GAMM|nr:CDP-archaeol synthase [Alkalilimnicola ehrlichii]RFA31145.1 hypothetical protein CAI21_00330 [Alkalilimnicola ehrlichii]RFA39570.1 hypothetical protein CAL65_02075 [Alkalilimnicola ehrlichii]